MARPMLRFVSFSFFLAKISVGTFIDDRTPQALSTIKGKCTLGWIKKIQELLVETWLCEHRFSINIAIFSCPWLRINIKKNKKYILTLNLQTVNTQGEACGGTSTLEGTINYPRLCVWLAEHAISARWAEILLPRQQQGTSLPSPIFSVW